jgi:hypothetical protein
MSTNRTSDTAATRARRRKLRHLRAPKPSASYVPFAVPEGAGGEEVLRAHLDWLLRNLDHLALSGHATVQTATAALHRDLLLLRMVEPVGQAAPEEPQLYYTLAQRFVAQHERTSQQFVKLMDLLLDGDPRSFKAEWEKLRLEIIQTTQISVAFREADKKMKQSTGR